MDETTLLSGEIKPGSVVGRFRITRLIDVGGMGVVYEAQDIEFGRTVALKHPRFDLGDPGISRQRFLRESRAASSLLHPNIVPILTVFEAEGVPWLAMELIRGESLRERIRRDPPLSVEEVLRHGEDLASALSEAHGKGILHRDLKPANVLLDSRGNARLMDFGLAFPFSSPGEGDEETLTRLTAEGFVVGTPGYVSPEQALGRPVDARSDIFCLGVILYEMCTGCSPFPSESDGWLDKLLHESPESLPAGRGFPEKLEEILAKAMAKDPGNRYQDAESMRVELSRLRAEVEAGLTQRVIRGLSRRRRLLRALGIGFLIALVGAASWFGRVLLLPEASGSSWLARPLTHDPAWAADPALSPDENLIAYVSGRSGTGDIWLIDREGENPLQLTHHPAPDRRPAWSPDGKEIYFTSFRGGEPAIWKISRDGGRPKLVLENGDDPALSPDGGRLAFVRRDGSGHYRVAISSLKQPEHLRFLTSSEDGFWYHRNPSFSPDGKLLSYNSPRTLWLVPSKGGRAEKLMSSGGLVEWARWCKLGLVFARQSSGTSALWCLDPETREAFRLLPGCGFQSQVSPSRDGHRMVYSTQRSSQYLEIVNCKTKKVHRVGGVFDPDDGALAPDGSSVVFTASYREGKGIFQQGLEGGTPLEEPRLLISGKGTYANPVFSPDGKWIAYHRVLNDQRDIIVFSMESMNSIPFTTDPAADVCPFFSPDGQHLAFSSDRSGRMHIWWAPIAEGRRVGEAEQLTFENTTDYLPRISPDGSMLVWLGNRDRDEDVWIRSLVGEAAVRKLTRGRRASSLWWEPGSRSVLVSADWAGGELSARRIRVSDAQTLSLDLPLDFGHGETGGTDFVSGMFSLSSDGKLMSIIRTELTGDLWMMESEGK